MSDVAVCVECVCVCVRVCVCAESAGSYFSSKEAVSKSDHQAVGALLSAGAGTCVFVRVQSHMSKEFLVYPCMCVCPCVCASVCCKAIPISRANTGPITTRQTAARPSVCI